MTTIGVAMSVYNGEATIDAALASIAAQTRPPDAVVVVDDGSNDRSRQRVSAWQAVLPLVLVAHEENRGLAAGRTTGIQHLDTDLVLALDADDAWLPHHLALMAEAYERRPGIVSPNVVAWDPTRRVPVRWSERHQPVPKHPDLAHLLVSNWLFSGSVFERAAFDAVGGCYRFAGCDDWDLWIRLVAAGASIEMLEEPTVLYRVHDGNMSGDDRLLGVEIEVLEDFVATTADASARAAAEVGLRHRRARLALRASYERTAEGRTWAARAAGARALFGPRNVQLRGLAMIGAPRRMARRRELLHGELRRQELPARVGQ